MGELVALVHYNIFGNGLADSISRRILFRIRQLWTSLVNPSCAYVEKSNQIYQDLKRYWGIMKIHLFLVRRKDIMFDLSTTPYATQAPIYPHDDSNWELGYNMSEYTHTETCKSFHVLAFAKLTLSQRMHQC